VPKRRYHIHVVCAANDQPLVVDRMAIFFQSRAFLTYDVSSKLPQAALHGRQCIEACDYAVVVIGDNYGATHNTGVSQMHLSYLSAKAKLKPMLILIKTHQEDTNVSRHLQDFTRLVEQQASNIYYYDDSTNIDQLLTYAYNDMIERYPATGWVRANAVVDTQTSANASSQSTRISSTALSSIITSSPSSSYRSTAAKRAHNDAPAEVNFDSITQPLTLTDTFDFQYSAQAYEGGNLTDVTMGLSCQWQEILQALIKIPVAFSSYGLQSSINRLITSKAERDIKQRMPDVHAVSRCQIAQNDLVKLQRFLVAANWIQLTASGARSSQELWKLTFYAKKLFENSKEKTGKL
jgi:hypothetical protein